MLLYDYFDGVLWFVMIIEFVDVIGFDILEFDLCVFGWWFVK